MIGSQGAADFWRGRAQLPVGLDPLDRAMAPLTARYLKQVDAGAEEDSAHGELPSRPGFAAFELALTPTLVRQLRASPPTAPSIAWAEKLMRFCEIYRLQLDRRAGEKWPERAVRRRGFWAIAAILAEASLATGDFRYVNTAAKLCDRAAGGKEAMSVDERGLIFRTHAILARDCALAEVAP